MAIAERPQVVLVTGVSRFLGARIAATLAANSRRARTGNVPITCTSSRSGKNKSHWKTVISPITTNE